MAIYDILAAHRDQRDGGDICSFNGYLEDYLGIIEEDETKKKETEVPRYLHTLDENLRVCTDLHLSINREAIANQIIRYKDAFKMPDGEICVPYIIYGKDENSQRASILLFGEREDYIFAKAYYYVISEPDNMYEGTRNEIISMVYDEEMEDVFKETMERYFVKKEKAGLVQRVADRRLFKDYDDMIALAKERGDQLQEEAKKELPTLGDDAQPAIYRYIMKWFLLKKFSYVQFMMDKRKLQDVFEGNVKKQRHGAKDRSDAISFISYREMWQIAKGLSDGSPRDAQAEQDA